MKQTLGFGDTRTWKHIARVPQHDEMDYKLWGAYNRAPRGGRDVAGGKNTPGTY